MRLHLKASDTNSRCAIQPVSLSVSIAPGPRAIRMRVIIDILNLTDVFASGVNFP